MKKIIQAIENPLIIKVMTRLPAMLLALSAAFSACSYYSTAALKPPERQSSTITERSYIRVMINEKWKFMGYVEKHEKVAGVKLERYTLIFDRNYEKVGYVDEFGKTYKISEGIKLYAGVGTIDMSCKLVFDLGTNDIITFEPMNLSKIEHVEDEQ